MAANLASALATLRDEVPELHPGDTLAEARANTWSVSPAEHDEFEVGQVVESLQALADSWLRSVVGRATFYAWYDEQAGQLRCSISSLRSQELPFGAPLRLCSPDEVVQAALRDPTPGLIPWKDLKEADAEGHREETPLGVWAVEKE